MAPKRFPLSYDDVLDSDIDAWLARFPAKRKSEELRKAIRFYAAHGDTPVVIQPPQAQAPQPVAPPPRKARDLDL